AARAGCAARAAGRTGGGRPRRRRAQRRHRLGPGQGAGLLGVARRPSRRPLAASREGPEPAARPGPRRLRGALRGPPRALLRVRPSPGRHPAGGGPGGGGRAAVRRVEVKASLEAGFYPVLIGAGALEKLPQFLIGKVLAIADSRVPTLPELKEVPTVRVRGGEGAKTMAGLERVLDAFQEAELGRDSTVVAVGG